MFLRQAGLPKIYCTDKLINFDQINRGLFIGSYPQSPVDIDRLKNGPRVTAVVNLQSDIDIRNLGIDWPKLMERYLKHDIAVLRIPIFDFDPEDLVSNLRRSHHPFR